MQGTVVVEKQVNKRTCDTPKKSTLDLGTNKNSNQKQLLFFTLFEEDIFFKNHFALHRGEEDYEWIYIDT